MQCRQFDQNIFLKDESDQAEITATLAFEGSFGDGIHLPFPKSYELISFEVKKCLKFSGRSLEIPDSKTEEERSEQNSMQIDIKKNVSGNYVVYNTSKKETSALITIKFAANLEKFNKDSIIKLPSSKDNYYGLEEFVTTTNKPGMHMNNSIMKRIRPGHDLITKFKDKNEILYKKEEEKITKAKTIIIPMMHYINTRTNLKWLQRHLSSMDRSDIFNFVCVLADRIVRPFPKPVQMNSKNKGIMNNRINEILFSLPPMSSKERRYYEKQEKNLEPTNIIDNDNISNTFHFLLDVLGEQKLLKQLKESNIDNAYLLINFIESFTKVANNDIDENINNCIKKKRQAKEIDLNIENISSKLHSIILEFPMDFIEEENVSEFFDGSSQDLNNIIFAIKASSDIINSSHHDNQELVNVYSIEEELEQTEDFPKTSNGSSGKSK